MEKKAKAQTNGFAIASLVLGAFSVLCCWTLVLPVPGSLLAFVFSALSRGNKKMCGMALAGMILGIVGLILALIMASSVISWVARLLSSDLIRESVLRAIYNFLLYYGIGGIR